MGSLKNKKVVLIGGAGFIGHHLALSLKKLGAVVEIIDSLQINNLLSFVYSNYSEENRGFYSFVLNQRFDLLREAGIPVEVQDARDYHILSRLLSRIQPDVIIQLAAVSHVKRSNKDPFSTFDHSLRTLENALDWAKDNVTHFIYFSSSLVYGHFTSDLVREDAACDPIGIYAALKFSGEKLVIAYNQVFDLPFTIVRPSALYGERCISGRIGQIFIENALKGKPIEIVGDGSDYLNFTFIDDLAQGIIKIIENEKSKGEIFNITYGESRSIKDVADILLQHFPKVKIHYMPKDKLMPERGTLCVDKAKKLFGYEPQYPLEKGFVKYIEWYKSTWPVVDKTKA